MWTWILLTLMFKSTVQNSSVAVYQELLFALVRFILELLAITTVFYIGGRIVVGKKRALFSDALIISFLGVIVSTVCVLFLPWIIGVVLAFVLWLALIRHYYETGWLGALAVVVMAVIVYVIISVAIALLSELVV
ncbi:MAG: hypothetical protein U9O89_05500 [Thermoproteota archaeon]|nr:hypothetical protein [Thermoproteota archaeon]